MGRRYNDDDDDRDRRLERSAAGDSGVGSAMKIVGIIGAIVLAIVLVCGGVSAFGIYMLVTAADRARVDLQKQLDKAMEDEQKRQRDFQEQQLKMMDKKKG